jgi:hypothetical protein
VINKIFYVSAEADGFCLFILNGLKPVPIEDIIIQHINAIIKFKYTEGRF